MIESTSTHDNTADASVLEAKLLSSIAEGDERAMAALFQLHSQLVFSVALRVLRERSAAEDVMQDVFLQIWRDPPSFSPARGRLGGFLAVVTRNRSIDVLRRRRPTDSVDDMKLASPGKLEDSAEHHLMIERVRELMKSLPTEQGRALEMAFFGGCSHREIAAKTGMPLGTVKTRVRSALHALKGALIS